MKKVCYLLLAFLLALLSSCSFNTTAYSNIDSTNTIVDLSNKDYEVIGMVEGMSKQVYVFGIGGLSKKSLLDNAKADMYRNADLKDGEAIIYPSTTTSVSFYLVVSIVRAKATGYKIRLHNNVTNKHKGEDMDNKNNLRVTLDDKNNLSITLDDKNLFNMIYVKGDKYDNKLLDDYYIGEKEVTEDLWGKIMFNSNSGNSKVSKKDIGIEEVNEFCNKLNKMCSSQLPSGYKFTIPTGLQWEFAAKEGDSACKSVYSGSNTISDVAWYALNTDDNYIVATKAPNKLGIYDMSGGVWEICQSSNQYKIRGGSFLDSKALCKITSVSDFYKSKKVGFRLVLSK